MAKDDIMVPRQVTRRAAIKEEQPIISRRLNSRRDTKAPIPPQGGGRQGRASTSLQGRRSPDNYNRNSAQASPNNNRSYAPQGYTSERINPADRAAFVGAKKLTLRHELKYYINYRDYTVLRAGLKSLMDTDENGDTKGQYHIRSLYFDDNEETALFEKMAGNENRCKYRIRIYNFSDKVIRFEKKIKVGQYITKKAIGLTRSEYDDIMRGRYAFLLRRSEPFAHELYTQFALGLAPRVVVDYLREAYTMRFDQIRLTFDMELKSGKPGNIFDPNLSVMPMFEQGVMVLEVKFNHYLPDYVQALLEELSNAVRVSISKYVICRKYE